MFKSEPLSPAGTLKNMRYASVYGVDVVYAGQPRCSLRVRNNKLNYENLQPGVNEAHELGKEFCVVVNIVLYNAKLKTFIRDPEPVVEMGPDALIMSDPSLITLVCENFPDIDIHPPVQASAVNWATVKFWKQMGPIRVILSHELSLEGIEEICTRAPDMELGILVCGALRMAYSDCCPLSGYINKRDPNQGICTNACRREYNVREGKEDAVGNVVHKYEPIPVQNVEPTLGIGAPTDKVFVTEKVQYPGEYMAAFENEHDTHIMNSKDLRAIAHVERLTQMGVHSLEIGGHTKSYYYRARTAQAYRKATDDAVAGKPFDSRLLETLEGLVHRGYTKRFLCRHAHDDYQNYEYGFSASERQQFVGEPTDGRKGELAAVLVENKFTVGDSLELMTPQGNINFTLEQLENVKDEAMPVAPGNGYAVWILAPEDIDLNYASLMCDFTGESTRNSHAKQLITVIFQRSGDSQKSVTYRFVY